MKRAKAFEIKWGGGDFTTEELARGMRWYHHDFGVAIDNLAVKEITERLRLLEAVAEAARARIQIDYMGSSEITFAQYLAWYGDQMSNNGCAVLEAIVALEALDEKE